VALLGVGGCVSNTVRWLAEEHEEYGFLEAWPRERQPAAAQSLAKALGITGLLETEWKHRFVSHCLVLRKLCSVPK